MGILYPFKIGLAFSMKMYVLGQLNMMEHLQLFQLWEMMAQIGLKVMPK